MWIQIRTETAVDLKTPLKKSCKKCLSKNHEVRPEPWVVRSHKFPKPPWHVVDPERGAAAVVVGTVGRRWEAVGTAVDSGRGAAAVVETVGRRWEAVGKAVAPLTR
jgi:hypothetical protein